jgi:hypothetical protein
MRNCDESIAVLFKQCRRDKLRARLAEMEKDRKKRPRHVKYNLKQLIKKSEEQYVDIQQRSDLIPVLQFANDKKNNPTNLFFKTMKAAKKYIEKELKLKVVTDDEEQR